jgi:mono/diheme cytochrome c family protein
LPEDDTKYPAGPHADVINANCTACHSATMALYQPRLTAPEWTAEVNKMRQTYMAPVAEANVPDIVAYLTNMSDQRQ